MSRTILSWGAWVLCAALTACGGSVDGTTATTSPAAESSTEVPIDATASVSAFFQYLLALVDAPSESTEPLSLINVNSAPSSEADEPTGLN